jgi:dipeptidyl aminopeptidase/acylaminoacyl peptidase
MVRSVLDGEVCMADGSAIRRVTSDDLFGFRLISEPQFSPDGLRIAYVITTIEREKNDYRSSIYVSGADGSSERQLTRADAKDSQPRWSPDGSYLAFVSNRTGKAQVWLIRSDGGEAWQCSDLGEGVTGYAWSPDSQSLCVVSKSTAESESNKRPAQRENARDTVDAPNSESDVKHITKIRYRFDGEGYLDQQPANLWIIPATGDTPRQLTSFDANDGDPVWSPNGREIAFVSNRTADRDLETIASSEIWSVVAQSGEERRLLGGDDASFFAPAWSPDGSRLAALGNWHAKSLGAKHENLWLVPAGGGESSNLSDDFDRSITDATNSDMFAGSTTAPVWSPDGRSLYFLVSDAGNVHVYRASVEEGEIARVVAGDRRISAVRVSPDGRSLAYVAATATNPGDLYVAGVDGRNERRVTNVNRGFLGGIALAEPEELRLSAPDGTPIQGWVLKPADFTAARKYPMILQIHGGPHTMYGNAFMHEFQLMAARGYVVVYVNPRGSVGYGEEFTTTTRTRWGESDMPDLMAAVDWVIAQGYVDENRLGVTGGSYGGYMTLWVIGHTDRFRAAVAQRAVTNLHSFYGTSDIGFFFGEYQFGGNPWENRELLMKYSPISYVTEMKTPLLIVHSEEDYRCPIEQAEQLFISLKRLGREVELVRFPGENHNLSRNGKPRHRIERLEHIVGWFDRHL